LFGQAEVCRELSGLSGIAAVANFNYRCGLGIGIGIGICEKCRKMAVFAHISAPARIPREKWRFSAVF
jgi:hypothetical protein